MRPTILIHPDDGKRYGTSPTAPRSISAIEQAVIELRQIFRRGFRPEVVGDRESGGNADFKGGLVSMRW